MSQQQIGRLLLIQIGDGATSEKFNNLCGVTTSSFNMSANEVDTTIPDCENPEATPQKTSEPGIKNRTFTGSGKFVAGANTAKFREYINDAVKFNAKVIVPGWVVLLARGSFQILSCQVIRKTQWSSQLLSRLLVR